MKKICALILVLVVILAAVPVGAERYAEVLAQFSDAEIQSLAAIYNAELLRRAGEAFTLEPGIYMVGVDVPELAYRVETTDEKLASVWFYAGNEEFSQTLAFYTFVFDPTDLQSIGRIYLAEGNVIEVNYRPVRFIPYTGVTQ